MAIKETTRSIIREDANKSFNVSKFFVYCFALFWSIVILYPLFVTIICSFKTNEEIFGQMFLLPRRWVWKNYVDAIVGAKMGRAVFNSLYVAAISTVITIILASMASYVLARQKYRFVNLIYILFIVGVMLPIHSTLIPINRIANIVGGSNSHWFLILIYVVFQLPQAIFLTTGFMKSISSEIEQAATIDGCSMIGTFVYIIIPISIPIIATAAILTFIYAYGELIFSVVLLTDVDKFTMPRALLYFRGERTTRMGPVFASVVVGALPMLIIYVFLHERIQSGMVAGAVKG